jgi:GH24 family phage-related lysozyme (muramidase)
MTEQFDEGVKEILLALFSLGASVYEADYLAKQINNRPEPIEQKIQAIETAEDMINNPSFNRAADSVLKKLKSGSNVHHDKMSDDQLLSKAADYIIPNEIYGNDLNLKQNAKFKKPYLDDRQIWTIGIGHKLVPGDKQDLTDKEIVQLFKKDLRRHLNLARTKFAKQWSSFTPELKVALIDISFRGDLEKKGKGDFGFVDLIKQGKFKQAAATYLDHTEYKSRSASSHDDGVVKRMEKNAKNIRIQS